MSLFVCTRHVLNHFSCLEAIHLTYPQGCCASRPGGSVANNDGSYDPPGQPRPASRYPNGISPPSSQPSAQAPPNARPNRALEPIPSGLRSTLPNTLASPTTSKSRHRVRPLTGSASQAWTRSRLDRERADWWDTRVTGSPEVWATLRAVVDFLQQGDVMNAQALLDAQGCTCPEGQLWRGVFDPTGVGYKIPDWIVVEPNGLVEEEEAESSMGEETGLVGQDHTSGRDDAQYVVRVRISSTAQDFRVNVWRRETIARIRAKLKTQAQVRPRLRCTIAFIILPPRSCSVL